MPKMRQSRRGHVYFAQSAAPGAPIKIGFSEFPGDRLERLRLVESDSSITFLGVFDGSTEDEARLHRLLAADRLYGEWFTASKQVRAAARGDWPKAPLVNLYLEAPAPNPNDVVLPFHEWTYFVELDGYWAAGLGQHEIAEVLGESIERVQADLLRMAKLGFLRGVPLRTRPDGPVRGIRPERQHAAHA